MRLFLSSENVGNYPEVFSKLIGANKKLAFIENAKDDWADKDRKAKVKEHQEQFENLGFDFKEINLRDFFNQPKKLNDEMQNYGAVFVAGGNTFILRRAMVLSGFDTIIKELLGQDKLVYGGSSAGSVVAGPTLHGTEHGDEPDVIPEGYIEEVIWDGLDLVPFTVVPHYGSEWFGQQARAMEKYLKENNLPQKLLKDGQVIVVNDDKEEFLQ
jgi:dipeptidase E